MSSDTARFICPITFSHRDVHNLESASGSVQRMPSASSFNGYKHVDAFGAEDEYEEDSEEVSYVTLDLGVIEPTLVPSSAEYRLIVS